MSVCCVEFCLYQAKVILNIDPRMRMGRKDEALLQEKFLDGIGKAEKVGAEQCRAISIKQIRAKQSKAD